VPFLMLILLRLHIMKGIWMIQTKKAQNTSMR
jgi:hypothetical protein